LLFVLCGNCVIAFILLKNKDNAKFIVGGIVLFYFIGAVYYLYGYNRNLHKFEEFAGKNVVIRGYIDSAPEIKGSTIRYVLKTEEIRLKRIQTRKRRFGEKFYFPCRKAMKFRFLNMEGK